jgi:hypothetical protein
MAITSLWFAAGTGDLSVGIGAGTAVVGDNLNTIAAPSTLTRAITALQMTAYTETVPTITAGDYVFLQAIRYGAAAADTVNADAFLVGWLISYTADS